MSDTDTTITALLEELKEVDPETWEAIYETGFNRCHWPDDLIQGCIQRAIASQGWEYQIAYQPHIGPDDRHDHAYVWTSCTKCYKSHTDTPAAAILAAYIQAVRASR